MMSIRGTSLARVAMAALVLALPASAAGQDASLLHRQAGAALQEGRFQDAAALLQQAIQLSPGDARLHVSLGYAYTQLGRNQEAVPILERAVALDPSSSSAHVNLGLAFWNLGLRERAVAEYGAATRLDPSNAVAHYNLGNSHVVMGSARHAVEPLERAVALQPAYVDALVSLGAARILLEEYGRALEPLQAAAGLAPNRSDVQYNLGLAQGRLGNLQAAADSHAWLQAYQPELATTLQQQLGDAVVRGSRIHPGEPERDPLPEPTPADPSITLLGRVAEENAEFWDRPGAEDGIVGLWGGAFDHRSMSFPLGEGVLKITKAENGQYQVSVASGWVRMGYKDEDPYFQGCFVRFQERRGSGFNSIFTFQGDSGLRNSFGTPLSVTLHLQPHPYGNIRLVTYIGDAGPADLSGLQRVQGG